MGKRRSLVPVVRPSLGTLPRELLDLIFSYVDWKDLCRLAQVCREWRELCDNHSTWMELIISRGFPSPEKRRSPKAWFCHLQASALFVGVELDRVSTPVPSRHGRFRGILAKLKRRLTRAPRTSRSHFATLQQAVQAAKPGQRIFVMPGHYQEHVLIDTVSVRIIGLTPPKPDEDEVTSDTTDGEEEVKWGAEHSSSVTPMFTNPVTHGHSKRKATPPVIDVRVSGVSISNISFTRKREQGSSGRDPCVLSLMNAGDTRLKNVTIIGCRGSHNISMTGALSRLTLTRCTVMSGGMGAFVSSGSKLVVKESVITRSKVCAVKSEGAELSIRQSSIAQTKLGIWSVRGTGKVSKCRFTDISALCMRCTGPSKLNIDSNTFKGARIGILVAGKSTPSIRNNQFEGHTRIHIEIRGHADPDVRDNVLHPGAKRGILCHRARGKMVNNTISGCTRAGIEIHHRAQPVVEGNTIQDCDDCGVLYSGESHGLLTRNVIRRCKKAGIEVSHESDPVISSNELSDHDGVGILVINNGAGTITRNQIYGNKSCAVELQREAKPMVTRNALRDCGCGVLALDNSSGTITLNLIYNNSRCGIEVQAGANPTMSHNAIYQNKETAVYIHNNGQGKLYRNFIASEGAPAITLLKAVSVDVNSNLIRHATHGIHSGDGTSAKIVRNVLYDCTKSALSVAAGAVVSIRANHVQKTRNGVRVHKPSTATVEDNVFHKARHETKGCENIVTKRFQEGIKGKVEGIFGALGHTGGVDSDTDTPPTLLPVQWISKRNVGGLTSDGYNYDDQSSTTEA